MSVIANVAAWFAAKLDITQFADQVRMRLISQLFNGISSVFQKIVIYFNGTIILAAFVPSFPLEPVIFYLKLSKVLLPGKLSRTTASVKVG